MRLFFFCLFSVLSCIPAFCEGVVKMPVLKIYFEGQVSRDMDYVNGSILLTDAMAIDRICMRNLLKQTTVWSMTSLEDDLFFKCQSSIGQRHLHH